MRKIFTFFTVLWMYASMFLPQQVNAQAPEKLNYQAIIRNTSNTLITNQAVRMQISILQGFVNGTVVYAETQTATTNANGLVSVEIGSGTSSNTFSAIDWANGPHFVKVETDPTGGTNYTITGTTQLLSVPYALYAKTSGSSIPGPQGPQGVPGPTGPTGATGAQGPQGLAGPVGATGAQGPQGAAGTNGIDGKTILSGVSAPTSGTGTNGDFYINTTTNEIYGPKTSGAWGSAVSLVGPTGATGPQGPQGPQGAEGPAGATGPQGPQGIAGPVGATGATGAQGPQGAAGTNGIDGKTILSGVSAPTSGTGTNGDFYINTATNEIYGPKTSGAWGSAVSLVGPTGPTGPTGLTGAQGPQGVAGPIGATGPAGAQGPAGTNGKIINVTYHVNSTRTPLPTTGSSIILESIPVNKLSSTSNLIIDGTISGWQNYSGAMQQGWRLGTGTEFQGQAVMYANDNYARIYPTKAVIANHTTTGLQNLVFRFYDVNGSNDRPFNIYNPSSLDDPRLGQTSSVYIIYEIEP